MVVERILVYFVVVFTISYCSGEVIKTSPCTDDNDLRGMCDIHQVRIEPCTNAKQNKPCTLVRGKTYKYEVDFTALVPIDTMKALPYWPSGSTEIPFAGLSNEACQFTPCPIAQNTTQNFYLDLKIGRILPRGKFDIKWKMWNENNQQGCCVRFALKII